MDRTLLNIISILVGGAGIFTVLTGFNVPELNMSFFGENPFAVKRDSIETTMKWVFTCVALIGLLSQLWAEIWGGFLPSRSHNAQYYFWFSVGALIVIALLLWMLTWAGNRIARWHWQPTVIELQREIFDQAKFIVEHEGWAPEHWANRNTAPPAGDLEKYKAQNSKAASEQLTQIEKLLDIESRGNLRQRVATLQPMFDK